MGTRSGAGGAAGEDCWPLKGYPIDTSGEWCALSFDRGPDVIGCVDAFGCSEDLVCVKRKSDGAVFLGLGSSCFEKVLSEWELCVPHQDDFPECSASGDGGAGGQGGT